VPDERAPGSRRRRWIGIAVSVVLVVAVFGFLLPKLADYADVWDTVKDLDDGDALLLSLVGVWNLFALAPLVMTAQPGVRFVEGFVNINAGSAVANTVPGGSAIGIAINWAMFDSWGFTPAEYTLGTLLSGIWNNFVKLSLPVVALLALATTGDLRGSFVPAAVVGVIAMVIAIVFFALVLRSDDLARSIGTLAGRVAEWGAKKVHRTVHGDTWGDGAIRFRHRSVDLIKRRWPALTVTALIGQLSLFVVLLVAVRAVGLSNAEVSWAEVLASWAFVRLISAIPITPGGLGVVELGLTAALANGENTALTTKAAAAVLLYRFFTYLLPIPVGAGCYVFWRLNHRWRDRHRTTVTA
jgi:uncharacterized membrane protein YbhN (UPF0104 family)